MLDSQWSAADSCDLVLIPTREGLPSSGARGYYVSSRSHALCRASAADIMLGKRSANHLYVRCPYEYPSACSGMTQKSHKQKDTFMAIQKITGGIWPAVLSAVDTAGTPNMEAMDQLVELFVEQELDGLYLLGSTGQGPALSLETRKAICERVCQTNNHRLPVMVHVGAVSVYDAIELAKHAADCGADAISSVPPIYFPVDVNLTFAHYEMIASATELPFFPYHAAFNQLALPSSAEYGRRLKELPHFAGVKLTEANFAFFSQLRDALGDDYVLFSGFDELLAHGIMSGSDGAIGTFMNLWGPVFKKADQASRQGDTEMGQRLTRVFLREVIPFVVDRVKFISFLSRAMYLTYNIDIGEGRSPFCIATATIEDDVVREVVARVNAVVGI